ncbi:MAG: recombinase family protein [Candidatus Rokuibacteriota bacterium]
MRASRAPGAGSNVRQPGGPVLREVNPAEAAIVRRIFELCAQGRGLLRIARTLNQEGVVNPTGQDRSRPNKRAGAWSTTGSAPILHQELYRGGSCTGRRAMEYSGGQAFKVAGEAPVILERPELGIIPGGAVAGRARACCRLSRGPASNPLPSCPLPSCFAVRELLLSDVPRHVI